MAEKNERSFLGGDWLDAQQKYWQAWSELYQKSAAESSGASTPGTQSIGDALELWWKAVTPAAASRTQPFMEKLLGQGKSYFQATDQFSTLLSALTDVSKSGEDWQHALNARFNELKSRLEHASSEAQESLHRMFGFWELPLDTWRRTASSMSVMPGDLLSPLKPEAMGPVAGDLRKTVDKFLSVPGVGYTRESQEQAQEGVRLWSEYQSALQEYNSAFTHVAVEALERLRNKLVAMGEKDEAITSLRELYDLWVEAAEEAYAEYVFTEEYSDAYARLVNALMAVKHHGQRVIDEALGALNMPTRGELDSVQRRNQELRREVKAIKHQLDDVDLGVINERVVALSSELEGADLNDLRVRLKNLQGELEKIDAVRLDRDLATLREELGRLLAAKQDAEPAPQPERAPAKAATTKRSATRRSPRRAASAGK